MPYPWAALEKLRASELNDAIGATDWASYTPVVTNGGTATFSSITGRWRRIGPTSAGMIAFSLTLVVGNAGSGAGVVSITAPTDIDRTVRWVFAAAIENAGLSGFHALTLTSGSGSTIDRLRSGTATNLTGADLTAGRIIAISGAYEEG
ncbi:MAG TPA: hypothetical protein VF174_15880 [Micromonosporaceae bacterium]